MNDNGPVRIGYTISIGFATAVQRGTFTIDRDEWNGLTASVREKYIEEMYETELSNVMDGGWEIENADLDDPVIEG